MLTRLCPKSSYFKFGWLRLEFQLPSWTLFNIPCFLKLLSGVIIGPILLLESNKIVHVKNDINTLNKMLFIYFKIFFLLHHFCSQFSIDFPTHLRWNSEALFIVGYKVFFFSIIWLVSSLCSYTCFDLRCPSSLCKYWFSYCSSNTSHILSQGFYTWYYLQ